MNLDEHLDLGEKVLTPLCNGLWCFLKTSVLRKSVTDSMTFWLYVIDVHISWNIYKRMLSFLEVLWCSECFQSRGSFYLNKIT